MCRLAIIFKIILLFLINTGLYFGQGTAGSNAKHEFRNLVDLPSAGVLKGGQIGVTFNLLPNGILTNKIEIGVIKNFNIGISYSASNFIGTGAPEWYPRPGLTAKLRLFTELKTFPSITVGFDSQGKGLFIDSLNRYEIKSPGAYLAVGKNFKFFGFLSIHGILNYSFENKDGDENINLGFGIEKTIGSAVSLIAEYDIGLNDNSKMSIGNGKGYLNAGIRWSAGYGITIGLDLRNILQNNKSKNSKALDRAILIDYMKQIF